MQAQLRCISSLSLATILWLCIPALGGDEDWISLFNGKSLDGWTVQGGSATYKVEDGAIVGTTAPSRLNTFLCKGDYKDFMLELEVKCDPKLNSGVQVRSHVYEQDGPDPLDSRKHRTKGVVYAPQCEIALHRSGTAGRFYDESRRDKWICDINNGAKDAFRDTDWNHYKIVVQGNRYRSWVNGIACSDFIDDVDQHGLIGLQVHVVPSGEGPYQVRWRNIKIKVLKPGEEAEGVD
jgi:hypothetical protein